MLAASFNLLLIENFFLLNVLIKPLVLSLSLIYLQDALALTLTWKFILPQPECTRLFLRWRRRGALYTEQLHAASVQPAICSNKHASRCRVWSVTALGPRLLGFLDRDVHSGCEEIHWGFVIKIGNTFIFEERLQEKGFVKISLKLHSYSSM